MAGRDTPTRYRIAAMLTALVVAAFVVRLVLASSGGGEDASASTTTASATTGVPAPPPLYERAPSWNIRGHSRFADAERTKSRPGGPGPLIEGVENVPPTMGNATTTTVRQRVISLEEAGVVGSSRATSTTGPTTSGSSVARSGATSSGGGTSGGTSG